MAKRILIIEDDPGILELLYLIFETEGYIVDGFLTGKTAEDIVSLTPDVIILDIRIEGYAKTGDQICSDLKALIPPYGTPVLLLSAEKDLVRLAKECLSDSYLSKPFNVDALLAKVKQLAA